MTTEIWPGSRLSLAGDGAVEAIGANAPDPFVLGFLLAASLALIILYSRLIAAIAGGVSFFRSTYSTSETLGNKYLCDSILLVYILVVPFYAMALRLAGLGNGYMWVFGTIAGILLLREAVLALVGWLSGSPATIRAIAKVGYGVFILVALASFLPAPVILLFPPQVLSFYRIYLAIIALIGYIMYVIRSFSLISSTGFSRFYWVLYLCTLEILPVSVVVNYLLNGN